MKSYNSIDLMKFIMAILIICIHTDPLKEVMPLINYGICQCIARVAVPLFFMTSGFLLFQKMDFGKLDIKKIKNYVKHIFKLYVSWSLIYIPLIYADVISKPGILNYNIVDEINNIIMGGSYLHLWFLKALISASIFSTTLLLFKINKKKIIKILFILYILALFEHSYYGIYKYIIPNESIINIMINEWSHVIVTSRDGICFGAIYFFLGACISENIKKNKIPQYYTQYMLLSWLGLFIEAMLVKIWGLIRVADIYIMLIPTAYYTFVYILNIKLEDSIVYFYLRQQSMFIFYTHALFIYVYREFYSMNHFYIFVLTVVTSIGISHILIKLNNNIIIKHLS